MRVYSFLLSFLVAAFTIAAPVKVTFNFEGIDGEGIVGTVSVDDQTKSTTDKLVVYDLEPGKHFLTFYSEESGKIVPSLNGMEFTVGNEDMEVDPFEMAGLKKVKFIATGNVLNNIFDISYDFELGDLEYNSELPVYFGGGFLSLKHRLDFIDGEYVSSEEMFGYAYLLPGEYRYVLESSDFLEENPFYQMTVNDNEDLQIVNIDFTSNEWHKSVFKIVDETGNLIEDEIINDGFFYEVKSGKGRRLLASEIMFNNDTLYLKDGNYSFAAYKENDTFKHWKKVAVAGSGMEIVYTYTDEVKRDVNVSMKNAGANKSYVISFYTNGFVDWSEDMLELTTDSDGNAKGSISLSEGTFDYTIYEPSSAYNGKLNVKEGTECLIDLSGYKEYTISPVDGNENLIETENGNIVVLYQNNRCVLQSYYPYSNTYTCLLKKGETYEMWTAAGSLEYEADLRTIVAGEEDKFDIRLNEAGNGYFVAFTVDDDTPNFALNGRAVLEGTELTTGLFFDYLYAYIFNVPEGEYNYTVELEGYETIRGTVKVGPETAESDGFVEVCLDELLSEGTTGITNTTVKENAFSVYPSVVDDYINISNKNATQSVWNVALYSASGTVVCRDRILPDSDTVSVYVGNLDRGFYLMVIENETGRYTYKVMKR